MEKTLIVKAGIAYAAKVGGGTIADVSEINSLAEGALAFFTEDGALIPLAGPVPVVDNVFAAVGMPTGYNFIKTGRISRDAVAYEQKTHVHAQAKIMVIGADTAPAGGYGSFNLPATLAVGDTMGIWLYDGTKQFYDETRKKHYEVVATIGSSFNSMLTALAAKINADTDAVADVTVLSDATPDVIGLVFTAHTAGNSFDAIPDGLLINSDIQESGLDVSGAIGVVFNTTYYTAAAWLALAGHVAVAAMNIAWEGSSTQIKDLEIVGSIDDGNRNFYRKGPEWKVPSVVIPGELYDVITMTYSNPDDRPLQAGGSIEQKLWICIPDADIATLTTPLVTNIIANL